MRGGFGRNRYERPQPGQQIHSYDDALYPPRAYRYHVQQATAPALTAPTRSNARGEPPAHAIVLPTIDADAACGPFLKGAGGGSSSSSSVATSGNVSGSVSASSMSFMGRSASAASNVTDGMGFYPMDAERRPPPRLRVYFDCFVPDVEGSDVQTFSEVCRHAEPLNPFHYRELWAGMAGELATATATATVTPPNTAVAAGAGPVKKERVDESGDVTAGNGSRVDTSAASKEESAKPSAATRAASRAAQTALQRTLRALGVPDELSSMVLLAARVPAGGRLTRKQEKMLRLRPQRRPAPPRPIRRGAKVFLPAYALLASGEAQGNAEVEAMAVTGGLIDVTAAGPRVLRVAEAAARQRGVFGTVGGGDGFEYGKSAAAGAAPASAASAVLNEFAFDDEDDEDGMGGNGGGGRAGRRAGGRRGRGEEDGLAEGDIPLIALGRWSHAGGASNGVGGAVSGGAGLNGTGAVATAGQLDEEAEEDSDEEDDMSAGMAEDDDDDANFSSDGGNDNDSFGGGGDDGNDDY